MKIVSEVYSEVGKALVNTGLGTLLASLIAWLFTKESIAWWNFPVGVVLALAQVFFGAWLIQAAHHIKIKKENPNDD
jgi:FtsH-binding integral membrane protein